MSGRGDAEFEAFVAASGTVLLRLAVLLAGDRAAGEDLLQGALERTYRRWSHAGEIGSPEAYVRTAIVNAAARRWGRRRRLAEHVVAEPPEVAVDGGQDLVVLRAGLLSLLAELSPRQRHVIVLRYAADLSEVDVARLLGCSVGTVKAHASRGLQRLRSDPQIAHRLPALKES